MILFYLKGEKMNNKKSIYLIAIIFIVALIIFLFFHINKKYNDGIISEFTYNYWNDNDYYTNQLVRDGKSNIYYLIYRHNTGSDFTYKEVNYEDVEQLKTLIENNKLDQWNGYNVNKDNTDQDYGFIFTVKYMSGKSIVALGKNDFPSDYESVSSQLKNYFNTIKNK